MHTDSSASRTCLRVESAVECTATVLMPSSRQARRMRSAISPRLAMTILSSIWNVGLRDHEQRLAELHRFAVLHQDGLELAGTIAFDLIHHLHGLDDAQYLADLDLIAEGDKVLGAWSRRRVERAHHRCGDHMLAGAHRARGLGFADA